ncbi:hypothetical protein Lal_00002777 [Lupinus albus]|nr:hypothetical protein Lal_00002777 [Lupinus albus]
MSVKKDGVGVSHKSCESSLYNSAVVRAQPKGFLIIKKEWAAIRFQYVFRSFLCGVAHFSRTDLLSKHGRTPSGEGQPRLCGSPNSRASKA